MKKTLAALAAAAGLFAAGIVMSASASATTTTPSSIWSDCSNLTSWYVNGDEGDRKPTPTVPGLKFEGNDLIHHAPPAGLTTDTLTSGAFALATGSAAPDQPSFFSVEVRDTDHSGYATLRWNTSTNVWDMTTGGTTYSNANATALVNSKGKSKTVISFGIGYTNSPPGTVAATVKSVSFNGSVYPLTCPPVTMPSKPIDEQPPGRPTHTSPSPSVSVSTSATAVPPGHPSVSPSVSGPVATTPPATVTPSPSVSTSDVPIITVAGQSDLPQTGAPVSLFAAAGVALIGLGTGLFLVVRRRKVTYTG